MEKPFVRPELGWAPWATWGDLKSVLWSWSWDSISGKCLHKRERRELNTRIWARENVPKAVQKLKPYLAQSKPSPRASKSGVSAQMGVLRPPHEPKSASVEMGTECKSVLAVSAAENPPNKIRIKFKPFTRTDTPTWPATCLLPAYRLLCPSAPPSPPTPMHTACSLSSVQLHCSPLQSSNDRLSLWSSESLMLLLQKVCHHYLPLSISLTCITF